MTWNDDSWRDGYDAWKLASPDDYYDEPCDHEDYDVDTLEGRARCHRCGESWWADEDEILRVIDAESAYSRYEEEMNRKRWWSDLLYNIRHPLQAIHWEFQKRGWLKPKIVTDDDISF